MFRIKAFLNTRIKLLFILSLILNILIFGVLIFAVFKYKQISKNLSSEQNLVIQNQNLEKSRMNGTMVIQSEADKSFDEVIGSKEIGSLNTQKLSGLKFSKSTYDYRTTFDNLTAEAADGITITIERIENNSPYLVLYSPSEWLGVMSIKDLVAPIVSGYVDPKLYNSKINGVNFAKRYMYYPGSFKLQYDTVIASEDREHLYYLTVSSDWETGPEDKAADPVEWYAKHPSEKFQKLESFMKELILN